MNPIVVISVVTMALVVPCIIGTISHLRQVGRLMRSYDVVICQYVCWQVAYVVAIALSLVVLSISLGVVASAMGLLSGGIFIGLSVASPLSLCVTTFGLLFESGYLYFITRWNWLLQGE